MKVEKNAPTYLELGFFIAIIIITYACSVYFDLFEHIVRFVRLHENLQLDEFITVAIVLVFFLTIYAIRKWREQTSLNKVINKKNKELEKALHEIKQLKGMLPICSSCKKIRDDKGYWHQVESYIRQHSDAEFTHGLCPECIKKFYPDYKGEDEKNTESK